MVGTRGSGTFKPNIRDDMPTLFPKEDDEWIIKKYNIC